MDQMDYGAVLPPSLMVFSYSSTAWSPAFDQPIDNVIHNWGHQKMGTRQNLSKK